ncbi:MULTISPECIES: hypothetical protein [unclassified Pseudomonas]|uniref:hypothetical protein n=1 Tax=unclassified Pseudomonas TaxID=196821 RepID=UPI000C86C533|nr:MULTISPECIES: hypothetical protein [unclassified Pseudomonas]PMU12859.1 hypothetical protein C1X90_34675 [Pseudomonas sp. GP01-A9]PMU14158.1 hypothetical protein C1X88_34650 [Pseudomonas sp. GP01-A13]PMU37351.1 hypothetical protein C1X87_33940 [Pseudomonas sp. GP01-A14]PMU38845.1 hypothetical protein C1X89_15480 [Pseudomonas sp. GP01-A8]PMU46131.1 hypothetical protein C1X85_34690 [Pseudomonas sp. GP01-A6]
MDNTNAQRSTDYLDVLMWLETASEDEIAGAYWLASGSTKMDLRHGIQALMDSDRPALAIYFPELVTAPVKLADLPTTFPEVCEPLERLQDSISRQQYEPHYPLKGYGALSAAISELKDQGRLSAAQCTLLLAELAGLKKG